MQTILPNITSLERIVLKEMETMAPPVIPTPRQDPKFEASLDYIMRLCLKERKTERIKE